MINYDLLASSYVLLDNASKDELSLAVAFEQLSNVLNIMKYEQRFGNLDNIIEKVDVTFSDATGLVDNALPNFGKVQYLEFNGNAIEECPVTMLDLYYNSGLQRAAFWTDESGVSHIQLSIPQTGTLKVWYEPDIAQSGAGNTTVGFATSLRWCIATRHALVCLAYVKYEDEWKIANKPVLYQSLKMQADHWEKIYLELVNRIGTDRPFSRLPFMGNSGD